MERLLSTAASLRAQHYIPPGFNLFTILRSASDEVRLHSRFLAFLLDPRSNHGAGTAFLEIFLDVLNIQDFDCHGARVDVEYRHIDIVIRNARHQALLLENKIYAGDQDEQLVRYVSTLTQEGYTVLPPLYLTLDGSDADARSCGAIAYQRVSYAQDILGWLERCLPRVNQDAAVRESLLQYMDVAKRLTGQNQGGPYLETLKQLLLKDKNLILVKDLQSAYAETLKDLQLELWLEFAQQVKVKYPALPEPNVFPSRLVMDRYAKNNKRFGLYYTLNFMSGSVYIELSDRFYCGYFCDKEAHPHEFNSLQALSKVISKNGLSVKGLLWRYTTELNMNRLSDEDLMTLSDPELRKLAAEQMADDLYFLWRQAEERCRDVDPAQAR